MRTGATRPAFGLAAALALAGCDDPIVSAVDPVFKPRPRPAVVPQVAPPPVLATSTRSAEIRAYLASVQSAQLTQGLLRRDGGGPDTPVTPATLAANFMAIAFPNEYAVDGVGGILRRWDAPVRMGMVFGASVTSEQRRQDTAQVAGFARRLAQVTGHPVMLGEGPNFHVVIANEDERTAVLDSLAAQVPELGPQSLARLKALPRDVYCAVVAFGAEGSRYVRAVAIIRAENPALLRLSCIHEELAQGLGLAADSAAARPSIFNDDDEFALLTLHDQHLLAMLYDDALRPGMTAAQAEPIVQELAKRILASPRPQAGG